MNTTLGTYDLYEIRAAIFQGVTGYMAPGKDDRGGHGTWEERVQMWETFNKQYGHVLDVALDKTVQYLEQG
jgi:hypothetical protein